MITGTISASKLDGALPAINGANLTGVGDGVLKAGSNPATDTNPADGLGTQWLNTSSGSMYVCTDATTDANVWINVGGGSDNIVFWGYPASISGYVHGGSVSGWSAQNFIEKFSVQSDSNGSDVGDLTQGIRNAAGCSSNTHGYNAGGLNAPEGDRIEKYSFASDGNATDTTANLTQDRNCHKSYSTNDHGYLAGNYPVANLIDRFPFASSAHASDIGDLAVAMHQFAAAQSETHGWAAGGSGSSIRMNTIQNFTFASSTNSTDVCNMDQVNRMSAGAESATHGYTMGGDAAGGGDRYRNIEKWAFASSNNATNIADLSNYQVWDAVGISSADNGYCVGGILNNSHGNTIDKFSFSSDSDATGIGTIGPAGRSDQGATQH